MKEYTYWVAFLGETQRGYRAVTFTDGEPLPTLVRWVKSSLPENCAATAMGIEYIER